MATSEDRFRIVLKAESFLVQAGGETPYANAAIEYSSMPYEAMVQLEALLGEIYQKLLGMGQAKVLELKAPPAKTK